MTKFTTEAFSLAPAGKTVSTTPAYQWWEDLGYVASDCMTAHPLCFMEDLDEYVPLTDAESDVVEYGVAARSDAVAIEDALTRAIAAYERRDLLSALDALNEAYGLESNYGDEPATDMVASRILVEVVEE